MDSAFPSPFTISGDSLLKRTRLNFRSRIKILRSVIKTFGAGSNSRDIRKVKKMLMISRGKVISKAIAITRQLGHLNESFQSDDPDLDFMNLSP